jgi:hypothetical protein
MALADVLPLYALAPTIDEPPNTDGYARAVDFSCAIGGTVPQGLTSLPGVTVEVYHRLKTEALFPGKHLDDARQRYGLKVGEAHVGETGSWHIPNLRLRLGGNILTAIAEIQGQASAPSESVFIQMLPIADIYVAAQSERTHEAAQFINTQLWQSAYESHVHISPSDAPADLVQNLSRDWIFHFMGYGDATSLGWPTSSASVRRPSANSVTAAHIKQRPLCQLQLAVLAAPGSGEHPQADDSILRAFWEQGTRTVVGFHADVSPAALAQWSTHFWNLALSQYTVHEAATLAARDIRQRWHFPDGGISEEAVVILGDADLVLPPLSEARHNP